MKKFFLAIMAACVFFACGDTTEKIEYIPATSYDVIVSFDLFYNNAPKAPDSITISNSEKIGNKIPANPQRDGFKFLGWYRYTGSDWAKVTAADVFIYDTTLYARWDLIPQTDPNDPDPKVTIMFYLNYWESPPPPPDMVVPKGSSAADIDLPSDLQRTGFEFLGWSNIRTGGTILIATDKFTANISLYAQWNDLRDDVIITYDLNYDSAPSAPASVTIKSGDWITGDNIPGMSRPVPFMFMGWFTAPTGGEHVTRTTVLAEMSLTGTAIQKTLYAQWFEASGFQVDLNGRRTTNDTPSVHQTAPVSTYSAANGLTATFTGTNNQSLQIPLTGEQAAIIRGLNQDQTIQVIADWKATPVDPAILDEPVFRHLLGRTGASSNWDATNLPGNNTLENLANFVFSFSTNKSTLTNTNTHFFLQLRNGFDCAVEVNIKSIWILYDPNWTP